MIAAVLMVEMEEVWREDLDEDEVHGVVKLGDEEVIRFKMDPYGRATDQDVLREVASLLGKLLEQAGGERVEP